MKHPKRNAISAVIVAFLLVGAAAFWAFRESPFGHELWPESVPVESDVPVFDTPNGYDAQAAIIDLHVKTIAGSPHLLLITREDRYWQGEVPTAWPVYLYDARSRVLTLQASDKWAMTEGQVATLGTFLGGDRDAWCRFESGKLHCQRDLSSPPETVKTAGEYALQLFGAPRRTVMAVLSANGPLRPSVRMLPFMGDRGGGYCGQHYIEFFDTATLERLGPPIKVPFTCLNDQGDPVWSADDRFLVYPSTDGTKMVVLHAKGD